MSARSLMTRVFSALFLLAGAAAAEMPDPPPYYAITNANIVVGNGDVIENGTAVFAHGLVTAVGANVEVPAQALQIDGTGLTVYPGLIDAWTDLGLGSGRSPFGDRGGPPAATRGGSRGGSQTPYSEGAEDRPGTTPWKRAADEIKTSDNRIEKWRDAGFTSAVTAPKVGIFPGTAGVINLAGERPAHMVVAHVAALPVQLEGNGGYRGYPGALFGRLSYVEQLFLDADHYGRSWNAWMEGGDAATGVTRPMYDRSLETLRFSHDHKLPMPVLGVWAKEIHRVIKLAETTGMRPVVLGAHQGYAVADVLAEKNAAVVVSVDWPKKSRDGDPEADEPLRVLKMRDQAPSTPAKLAEAGVPFAFMSGELDGDDVIKGVKKAIDAGLSEADAIRGLTLGAAEIFGVSQALGSLEKGKIANAVVTDGNLFDEKTKVKMVFVDGYKFEIKEKDDDDEGGPPWGRWPGAGSSAHDGHVAHDSYRAHDSSAHDSKATGHICGVEDERCND